METTEQLTQDTVVYTAVQVGNPTDLLESVLGDRTPRQYLEECVQDMSEWLQESLKTDSGWFPTAAKAAEYLADNHDYPHQYATLRIVGTTARELYQLVVDAAEND